MVARREPRNGATTPSDDRGRPDIGATAARCSWSANARTILARAVGIAAVLTGAAQLAPLAASTDTIVSTTVRSILTVGVVLGGAVRAARSTGRQRWGWFAIITPFAATPLLATFPTAVAGHGDLAWIASVNIGAQVATLVGILLLIPESANAATSSSRLAILWPFPLLLGTLWTAGATPVLEDDSIPLSTRVVLAGAMVLLALQESLYLAPPRTRLSVSASGARLFILSSITAGLAQLTYNMTLVRTSVEPGSAADFASLLVLFLLTAAIIVYRPPRAGGETTDEGTRHRIVLPAAVGAAVVMRLFLGVGVGDAIFWAGLVGAMAYLGKMIAERDDLVVRLQHQATSDALTGLANRAALRRHLDDVVARDEPASVVYFDLDEFKMVNDDLGHAAGDLLLVTAAERLRAALPAGGLLARVGGDEFVAVIPRGQDSARAVAEEMITRMSVPIEVEGGIIEPRVSAGISTVLGDTDRALDEADMALYRAKGDRGSRLHQFDETIRTAAQRRIRIDSALPTLIERRFLATHYQPIVDMETGRWLGMEALVRWPTDADFNAMEIVESAERLRLMDKLTECMMQRVAVDLPELRSLTGIDLWCTVNVAMNSTTLQRLPEMLQHFIERGSDLEPSDIVLEITERELPADYGKLAALLAGLQLDGYRVAIDDFGAGYSALSHLGRVPFDVLKLDGAFTAGLPVGLDLITLVVELSHGRGALVVAEAVERVEQVRQLRSIGCDLGQGYHWLRPSSVDTLRRLPELARLAAGELTTVRATPIQRF